MTCCTRIISKRNYFDHFKRQKKIAEVPFYYEWVAKGNLSLNLENICKIGKCLKCGKNLNWEFVRQLVNGTEEKAGSYQKFINFEKFGRQKLGKCVLCNKIDDKKNLELCGFSYCGHQAMGHPHEME